MRFSFYEQCAMCAMCAVWSPDELFYCCTAAAVLLCVDLTAPFLLHSTDLLHRLEVQKK